MDELVVLLEKGDSEEARTKAAAWADGDEGPPTDHEGHLALLRALPEVVSTLYALPPSTRSILLTHVVRTSLGMRDIVAESDRNGRLRLQSLEELRHYCYVVAGIVGELLTALFLDDAPTLAVVKAELEARQRAFGEALQLVNILKDAPVDIEQGRAFLPAGVSRSEVVALARRDVVEAEAYVAALTSGRAPSGFIAFTGLPLELAKTNLELLERDGPGAKIPKDHVLETFARFSSLAQADHSASAHSGK